jgi:trigger factor
MERAPGSRVVLDVEVPPEEMHTDIEQAVRRLGRQVRIPGFRPGKAPAHMVERTVGRPRVLQEALNPLVTRAFRDALSQEGLEPVAQPEIEVREFEDGGPLHFVATVAVRPEVRLGDFRSVRVDPEAKPVGAEDVDRALEGLRQARAVWIPVEEPAAEGDRVQLDVTGQLQNGQRIAEKRFEGLIGAGQIRPEVEAAVLGLAPGASAEIDVEYGADDPSEALRGQSGHLRVDVREVRRRELPALDDAFASDVGEVATLEELRVRLGNRLRRGQRVAAHRDALDRAVARIVETSEVEAPQVLVERTIDSFVADLRRDLAARGIAFSAYLRQADKTEEQAREDFRTAAESSVRTRFVLEALAKEVGVEPTPAEVEAEIGRRAAAQAGMDPAHFRRVALRPENRAVIAAEMTREAAVRWVLETCLPPEPAEAEDGDPEPSAGTGDASAGADPPPPGSDPDVAVPAEGGSGS